MYERVKKQLHDRNKKYKKIEELKRRQLDFEVGDFLMAHIREGRFPRGEYNNLKHKKIAPCKVLMKFFSNNYEIEPPSNIAISPIFNVSDSYPFKEEVDSSTDAPNSENIQTIDWEKQLPTT